MANRYKNVINSGITVASNNLRPWNAGVSGNPAGRPKGSRGIKSIVRSILNDPTMAGRLSLQLPGDTETCLEAIVCCLVIKSMAGDVRAAEVLLKHAVYQDEERSEPSDSIFDNHELVIKVVNSDGEIVERKPYLSEITEAGVLAEDEK